MLAFHISQQSIRKSGVPFNLIHFYVHQKFPAPEFLVKKVSRFYAFLWSWLLILLCAYIGLFFFHEEGLEKHLLWMGECHFMEHDFEVRERGHILVVDSFEVNRKKGLSDFSFLPLQPQEYNKRAGRGLICTQYEKTKGLDRKCH